MCDEGSSLLNGWKVGASEQAGFGEKATKAAVPNPPTTMLVQTAGIAQRGIPITEFGECSAGKVRQGTDGLLHITPPHLGRFTDLPCPRVLWNETARVGGLNGTDRFRFVRATLHATEESGWPQSAGQA